MRFFVIRPISNHDTLLRLLPMASQLRHLPNWCNLTLLFVSFLRATQQNANRKHELECFEPDLERTLGTRSKAKLSWTSRCSERTRKGMLQATYIGMAWLATHNSCMCAPFKLPGWWLHCCKDKHPGVTARSRLGAGVFFFLSLWWRSNRDYCLHQK